MPYLRLSQRGLHAQPSAAGQRCRNTIPSQAIAPGYAPDATQGGWLSNHDQLNIASHHGARAACSSVLDAVGGFTVIFEATGARAVKDILAKTVRQSSEIKRCLNLVVWDGWDKAQIIRAEIHQTLGFRSTRSHVELQSPNNPSSRCVIYAFGIKFIHSFYT